MSVDRIINKIIVHHSASNRMEDDNIEIIRQWHKERGFQDIGYHFFIDSKGLVKEGRPLDIMGAHCLNYNATSIGICLSGDFTKKKVTKEQMQSLKSLIGLLFYQHNLTVLDLYVHKDFDSTLCPGFSTNWLRNALIEPNFVPDIYKEAVETFGRQKQLEKFMEELSECLQALIHHKNGKISDSALKREIADVYITLQQAKRIMFEDLDEWNLVKKEKLDKLRNAIDEAKD